MSNFFLPVMYLKQLLKQINAYQKHINAAYNWFFEIMVTLEIHCIWVMFNIPTSILQTQQNLFLGMAFEAAKRGQYISHNSDENKSYMYQYVYTYPVTNHVSIK